MSCTVIQDLGYCNMNWALGNPLSILEHSRFVIHWNSATQPRRLAASSSQAAADFEAPGKQLKSIFWVKETNVNALVQTPYNGRHRIAKAKPLTVLVHGVPAISDSAYLQASLTSTL